MILLWGLLDDSPMLFVYQELMKLKADVFFLNHADILETNIAFREGNPPLYILNYKNVSYNLNDFSSAYLRPYDFRVYGQCIKASPKLLSDAYLLHQCMNNWAEYTNRPVINKPVASSSNNSKLYQAVIIEKAGLLVPPSLVSNEREKINQFYHQHEMIIYKSMSGIRSIVEKYSPDLLPAGKPLGLMFFQKYIEGQNVRVHVAGSRVFANIITTTGVDYRYAPYTMEEYKLPDNISEKCILLNKKFGLLLSGIDLILTPDNEWYCLEVNTNPGYSFFDRGTGNPIAAAIAELLME